MSNKVETPLSKAADDYEKAVLSGQDEFTIRRLYKIRELEIQKALKRLSSIGIEIEWDKK